MKIIEDIKNRQGGGGGLVLKNYSKTCDMKMWADPQETKLSDQEAQIPAEYAAELRDHPEELLKSMNIDVPPEYMAEVLAALAAMGHRRTGG
ncbi:hypothetical protein Acr_13g0010610 [Actinidia rufa]|uniref:Uncharacterized protein n=1 Tax=Actinidia rufa TaxID=165716 RepID=A0A7J0FLQ8_9ERIC|nr:hypothetical protein Acr_13g0010610 [Actinidia rufa]